MGRKRWGTSVDQVEFEYEVRTLVRFSEAEVTLLSEICERHYDCTVKYLSLPGRDAVLNAARNTMENGFAEVRMTYRQLDTLRKGCEYQEIEPEHVMALYAKLGALMKANSLEWQRLKDEQDARKGTFKGPCCQHKDQEDVGRGFCTMPARWQLNSNRRSELKQIALCDVHRHDSWYAEDAFELIIKDGK